MEIMDEPMDLRGSRANELYWSSGRSVNSIAEDLDVSKGTLYGLLRPLRIGVPCPECGGDLEYPNRTARDRGLVVCADCGLEAEEELVRADLREATTDEAPEGTSGGGSGPREGGRRPAALPGLDDPRVLVGAVLLGVAAAILLLRGRRG